MKLHTPWLAAVLAVGVVGSTTAYAAAEHDVRRGLQEEPALRGWHQHAMHMGQGASMFRRRRAFLSPFASACVPCRDGSRLRL
jgi:hypothetical protein